MTKALLHPRAQSSRDKKNKTRKKFDPPAKLYERRIVSRRTKAIKPSQHQPRAGPTTIAARAKTSPRAFIVLYAHAREQERERGTQISPIHRISVGGDSFLSKRTGHKSKLESRHPPGCNLMAAIAHATLEPPEKREKGER